MSLRTIIAASLRFRFIVVAVAVLVMALGSWQVPQLHYPCWTAPVLSAKRLYLRCEERLVCLDLGLSKRGSPR